MDVNATGGAFAAISPSVFYTSVILSTRGKKSSGTEIPYVSNSEKNKRSKANVNGFSHSSAHNYSLNVNAALDYYSVSTCRASVISES